jgi:hypothetical protein
MGVTPATMNYTNTAVADSNRSLYESIQSGPGLTQSHAMKIQMGLYREAARAEVIEAEAAYRLGYMLYVFACVNEFNAATAAELLKRTQGFLFIFIAVWSNRDGFRCTRRPLISLERVHVLH